MEPSIRVGFLTPYYRENRGNATTTKRIEHGLKHKGIPVEIFAYEEQSWTKEIRQRLESCTVFHILHFFRFAKWLEKTHYELARPYIITNGGTDVNHHLEQGEQKQVQNVQQLVDESEALVVFSNDGKEKSERALGLSSDKVQVIPQSVWLPETSPAPYHQIPNGFPKLLLPAGLRPVKDVLYLIEELIELRRSYPLQFVLMGEVLDESVYQQVLKAEGKYEWFHYAGEIPFTDMKTWYDWSDIVLNSSVSEGQSSALLEAMMMGKLVIARTNPGNASMIADGHNGFLFEDGSQFL